MLLDQVSLWDKQLGGSIVLYSSGLKSPGELDPVGREDMLCTMQSRRRIVRTPCVNCNRMVENDCGAWTAGSIFVADCNEIRRRRWESRFDE